MCFFYFIWFWIHKTVHKVFVYIKQVKSVREREIKTNPEHIYHQLIKDQLSCLPSFVKSMYRQGWWCQIGIKDGMQNQKGSTEWPLNQHLSQTGEQSPTEVRSLVYDHTVSQQPPTWEFWSSDFGATLPPLRCAAFQGEMSHLVCFIDVSSHGMSPLLTANAPGWQFQWVTRPVRTPRFRAMYAHALCQVVVTWRIQNTFSS